MAAGGSCLRPCWATRLRSCCLPLRSMAGALASPSLRHARPCLLTALTPGMCPETCLLFEQHIVTIFGPCTYLLGTCKITSAGRLYIRLTTLLFRTSIYLSWQPLYRSPEMQLDTVQRTVAHVASCTAACLPYADSLRIAWACTPTRMAHHQLKQLCSTPIRCFN